MACLETFSTLRIFSTSVEPDEITRRLGIEPAEALPKDPDSPHKPRQEGHFWCWRTEGLIESSDSEEHLLTILAVFESAAEALEQLRELGCRTDINSFWVGNGQGGPTLQLKTMEKLCELGLPVSWDNYFGSDSET